VSILELLDYTGVAVFAATGALSASRKQLDIIGFLFLAAATGIGGGTLRDLVLGATPVFWVVKPTYLIVCVVVALIVFVLAHRIESRYRLLLWLDAMGVSAYCVMGAAKGLAATGSASSAIFWPASPRCCCGRKSTSPQRSSARPPSRRQALRVRRCGSRPPSASAPPSSCAAERCGSAGAFRSTSRGQGGIRMM
jgi:hypothetical protein